MSNRIFQALLLDKIESLIRSFETSKEVFWDETKKKLIHPGEYGEYREKAAVELLESFIPQNLKISEGFVISSNGDISTQCDIVIYDPYSCPKLADSAHQKFFPVESVIAVGEIKSDINTLPKLQEALDKLAKIKKMRESVLDPRPYRRLNNKEFTPEYNEFDQIFSFLLCKKIPEMPREGFSYSKGVEARHQHNMIVDIERGHACYEHIYNEEIPEQQIDCYYPQAYTIKNKQIWRNRDSQKLPSNFGIFLTGLFNHCQTATLLELDPVHYCTDHYRDF
ncbi:DUF6602 domain-containing protein [Idiomarina sp.]|uniref:DUF6602 domain-containing protein n=1 Tax=Idiomarina sp. TaxID=1874361 RepID=UPI0035114AC4